MNEAAGEALSSYLKRFNISYSIFIIDVQKAVEEQNSDELFTLQDPNSQLPIAKYTEYFTKYHTVDDINSFLDKLANDFPQLTQLVSIGKTFEGREQRGIRIHSPGATLIKKKEFVFHGGQHAREWIGPAVVQYIASELLSRYGADEKITSVLDNFDFVIIPVLNVDGYHYTHTKNRMWRKNRQPKKGEHKIPIISSLQ